MSLGVGGQSRWTEWRTGLRRIGQLLSQGSVQQRVLSWGGLIAIGISVILCLQELWRVLPAVAGVVAIGYALRSSSSS